MWSFLLISKLFKRLPLLLVNDLIEFVACINGYYGIGCSTQCGNCMNSEQCHHVNGICMNGCDNGYKGDKCIASKHIVFTFHV